MTAETELSLPGTGKGVLTPEVSPFYDREGRITGTIESIRNIPERRWFEEECR